GPAAAGAGRRGPVERPLDGGGRPGGGPDRERIVPDRHRDVLAGRRRAEVRVAAAPAGVWHVDDVVGRDAHGAGAPGQRVVDPPAHLGQPAAEVGDVVHVEQAARRRLRRGREAGRAREARGGRAVVLAEGGAHRVGGGWVERVV